MGMNVEWDNDLHTILRVTAGQPNQLQMPSEIDFVQTATLAVNSSLVAAHDVLRLAGLV